VLVGLVVMLDVTLLEVTLIDVALLDVRPLDPEVEDVSKVEEVGLTLDETSEVPVFVLVGAEFPGTVGAPGAETVETKAVFETGACRAHSISSIFEEVAQRAQIGDTQGKARPRQILGRAFWCI
jgi:hypothetical protein